MTLQLHANTVLIPRACPPAPLPPERLKRAWIRCDCRPFHHRTTQHCCLLQVVCCCCRCVCECDPTPAAGAHAHAVTSERHRRRCGSLASICLAWPLLAAPFWAGLPSSWSPPRASPPSCPPPSGRRRPSSPGKHAHAQRGLATRTYTVCDGLVPGTYLTGPLNRRVPGPLPVERKVYSTVLGRGAKWGGGGGRKRMPTPTKFENDEFKCSFPVKILNFSLVPSALTLHTLTFSRKYLEFATFSTFS